MRDGFGMMGDFGFGGFFMILWWVLIVVGIVVLVKWIVTSPTVGDRTDAARRPNAGPLNAGGRPGGSGSALDILNERYARGEIEEQDFKVRKRDLSQ